MRRISVIGSSGSGKSTVAQRIAQSLGFPYLELDSVMHQPDWEPIADEIFRERVAEFVEAGEWIVDGNYTSHGIADIVWPLADTIVWLDLPRRIVMSQVVKRTLRRAITREELWNGNREPLNNFFDPRPEKNIIVWAWTTHRHVREKYERAAAEGRWHHAMVHRLRTRDEIDVFVQVVVSAGIPPHPG